MRWTFNLLLAIATIPAAYSAAQAQASGYHVVKSFRIQSGGKWDYIAASPVTDNIYVSHGSQVNILNKNNGDSVGVISNIEGVHGIAFAPDFKKGFTSNGKLNTVTVFDINTNEVQAQVKTGVNPDAIMYDPYSKKVYVCNGQSKDLTIINPENNEVVKTVALGGKPETAVSDEDGKLYINIEDKNEIVVVNTKTYTVEKRWKTGKGKEPSGLAIDIKTKRLFAGCSNKLLVVIGADNGKVIKELPIGAGCDGVAFDPEYDYIFAANDDGTLTVALEKNASDITVIDNVPTKKGARTLAVDLKAHLIFLPTADFEEAAAGEKHPPMVPGTFQVLVVRKRIY